MSKDVSVEVTNLFVHLVTEWTGKVLLEAIRTSGAPAGTTRAVGQW